MLDEEPDLGKEPCFYLWPENAWMWHVFLACRTQWRHGFGGATGLDYAGVEIVLRKKLRLPAKRIPEAWRLLDAMEVGALVGWSEMRAKKEREQERTARGS